MIIGYSWEDKESANLVELKEIMKKADKPNKTHTILFHFMFSHFAPMQLTPMYYFPLNFIDYRKELTVYRNYVIYDGINIKAYITKYVTTPASAFDELYIERAFEKDYDNYIKIFNTKKYQLLSAEEKIRVIKEYANPELYQENYNITVNYLVPNYDFKKAVKIYE